MQRSKLQYSYQDLHLSVSQIESALGYKEGEKQETISGIISEVLRESEKLCEIKAEYRIFDEVKFIESEKSVKILDHFFDIKKIVYGQIRKSQSIAVFLCTAGEEIGLRSSKEMRTGDLLTGYIFDVVGSEMVESAADLMQEELEILVIRDGKKITNRFSPGYCGWDVVEQHKLFSLMPDNYCRIRLTPSALMDPVKSVSGFIGIGENVKRLPYTCNFCDLKDCLYRKKA